MNETLNALLARLRAAPPDRRLDQMEPAVWARIEGARAAAPIAGAWGWRAALAALMLSMGAYVSAAATAPAPDSSPFSVHAALAPSTLLEGGS